MAYRNILTKEQDLLYKKSRPVTEFNGRLHQLLDDMRDTLAASEGVGLAAPQVGVLRRIAIIEYEGETPEESQELIELINPKIIAFSGEQESEEGCLSVPGRWGVTRRPMHVTVRALNRRGETFDVTGSGLLAKAFCHEIDHLDGKLYIDCAIKMLDK